MNELQINKLIILYIFDQLGCPMQQKIVLNMLVDNEWMSYMDAQECFNDLIKSDLIVNQTPKSNNEPRYTITISGQEGLTHYYTNIPISIRESIAAHIKANRLSYRKSQEYVSDYYKNKDGTFTVALRIESATYTLMDLKIIVQTRSKAKWIYQHWKDKAALIYEHIHENLIE